MALSDINTQSTSIMNPAVCVRGANAVGSRLSITIQQDSHGFNIGTPVRWNSGKDGNTVQYEKAQANDPYNAEVVGIVAEILNENAFELVMSGIVKMNDFFSNTNGSIAQGPPGITADDVYFLSGYTAGKMTPTRPETPGWVAKPLITRLAEDANGNIYGHVTNYVGSHLGGSVAVSLDNLIPAGSIQAYAGMNVPNGWSICNGDGKKANATISGIVVSENQEYYDNVGLRHGWVERIKTNTDGWSDSDVGDYVFSTVDGTQIAGIIESVDGQYIYVKQSPHNTFEPSDAIFQSRNSNFRSQLDPDGERKRGENNTRYLPRFTIQSPRTIPTTITAGHLFQRIRFSDPDGTPDSFFSEVDENNLAGIYSVLAPDLRNRIILGAQDSDYYANQQDNSSVVGRFGGAENIDLNFQTNPTDGGVGEGLGIQTQGGDLGWADQQTNLPPYLTVNWIIRTSSSAYASILEKLTIKNLLLTGLPTSGSGQDQWTVYQEDGNLKIQPE